MPVLLPALLFGPTGMLPSWYTQTTASLQTSARFRPLVSALDCHWRIAASTPEPLFLPTVTRDDTLQAAMTAATLGWERALYSKAMAAPRIRTAYSVGRALTGGGIEVKTRQESIARLDPIRRREDSVQATIQEPLPKKAKKKAIPTVRLGGGPRLRWGNPLQGEALLSPAVTSYLHLVSTGIDQLQVQGTVTWKDQTPTPTGLLVVREQLRPRVSVLGEAAVGTSARLSAEVELRLPVRQDWRLTAGLTRAPWQDLPETRIDLQLRATLRPPRLPTPG